MQKLTALVLCCIFLGGCGAVTRGTFNDPLMPESTPNEDQEHATVIFYRADSWGSSVTRPGNMVVLINSDKTKQTYSPSEFLIANSGGNSVAKLSPGIHKFSLAPWKPGNDIGAQTALLKVGETYYLSQSFRFTPIPGALLFTLLNPNPTLDFTSEDVFLKEGADRRDELRITKGIDYSNKKWFLEIEENYEVIKKE